MAKTTDLPDPYVEILTQDIRGVQETLSVLHDHLPSDDAPDRRWVAACLVEMTKIRRRVDRLAKALEPEEKPAGLFS